MLIRYGLFYSVILLQIGQRVHCELNLSLICAEWLGILKEDWGIKEGEREKGFGVAWTDSGKWRFTKSRNRDWLMWNLSGFTIWQRVLIPSHREWEGKRVISLNVCVSKRWFSSPWELISRWEKIYMSEGQKGFIIVSFWSNCSRRRFRGLSVYHEVSSETHSKFSWQHCAFWGRHFKGIWGHPKDVALSC